jgi:hypothetical protein
MMAKRVLVDGLDTGSTACTLRDAALVAQSLGVAIDPDSLLARIQHISEGPCAFHVARRAGDYAEWRQA